METGTIIHGTARTQDLIPAFWAEAEDRLFCSIPHYDERWDVLERIESRLQSILDEDDPYWTSEEAMEDLVDLVEILNSLVPYGFYFGSHPGDGSDYGFWEIEDL